MVRASVCVGGEGRDDDNGGVQKGWVAMCVCVVGGEVRAG